MIEIPRPSEELLAECSPAVRAYIAAMEAVVSSLQARVGELEARLRQDSNTSSRPPSSDSPWKRGRRTMPRSAGSTDAGSTDAVTTDATADQKTDATAASPSGDVDPSSGPRRRPGGQPGHAGHYRPLVDAERVDRVVVVAPPACRGCGVLLPAEHGEGDSTGALADERVQVVELPPARAVVTEYRLVARRCRACGTTTRAERPAEAGQGSFGPRLQAIGALLVGRYRLSRREAVACLGELGQVELSVGALARLEQSTSMALAPVVDHVASAVRQAPVANLDETGWWQGSKRAWLWTMVTERLTLFRVDPSRGKAVVHHLLGAEWDGIVGSDRYAAYQYLPLERRQLCWAHLLREFRQLATYNQHQRPLGERLLEITARLFDSWARLQAGAIDRETLGRELEPIQTDLRQALSLGLEPPHAVVAGALCRSLLASWPALWTFALVDGVEPTNNVAERTIRPAVLWRKGSFGSQSEAGSRFVERMLTVVATCKQQGRGLLDFLVEALTAARLGLPPPSLVPVPAV